MTNLTIVEADLHQFCSDLEVHQLLSGAGYGNAATENPEVICYQTVVSDSVNLPQEV